MPEPYIVPVIGLEFMEIPLTDRRMPEPYIPGASYPVMTAALKHGLPLVEAYRLAWGWMHGLREPIGATLTAFWQDVKPHVRQDLSPAPAVRGTSPVRKRADDFFGMTGTRKLEDEHPMGPPVEPRQWFITFADRPTVQVAIEDEQEAINAAARATGTEAVLWKIALVREKHAQLSNIIQAPLENKSD